MELGFDVGNLPKDALISVRAGGIRRQAPISVLVAGEQKLKFPMADFTKESLKIDVLKPIMRGSLIFREGKEEGAYPFSEGNLNCTMKVSLKGNQAGNDAHATETENGKQYEDQAKLARSYLEDKSLLHYIQNLLRDTLLHREELQRTGEDPLKFMWKTMGQSLKLDVSNAANQDDNKVDGPSSKEFEAKVAQLKEAQDSQKKLESTVAELTNKMATFEKASPKVSSDALPPDVQKILDESLATLRKAEENRKELVEEVDRLQAEMKEVLEARTANERSLEDLAYAEQQREKLETTVAALEEEIANSKTSEATQGDTEERLRLINENIRLVKENGEKQEQLSELLQLRKQEQMARAEARANLREISIMTDEEQESEAMQKTLHDFDECTRIVEGLERTVDEQAHRINYLEEFLVKKLEESPIMMREAAELMMQRQEGQIAVDLHEHNAGPVLKPAKVSNGHDAKQEKARARLLEKFKDAQVDDLIPKAIELAFDGFTFEGYAIEAKTKRALAAGLHNMWNDHAQLDALVAKAQASV